MELQQTISEKIADDYLALISTNIEAWSNLLADEAIMELPYAAALGVPPRLEGKSAIYNYLKPAIALMPNITFTNVCKYPTIDPNLLWLEVHGEAIILATGHHYRQDFAIRIQVEEGKIVHIREYTNPIASMEAFGINHPTLNRSVGK